MIRTVKGRFWMTFTEGLTTLKRSGHKTMNRFKPKCFELPVP